MGQTDHAIIVGIERYCDPQVSRLQGARDDARRFHDWVTRPDGGGVPTENVTLFAATGDSGSDAEYEELKDAFVRLCLRAAESAYIGHRLYVYLAGHGIAQNLHEASLLAADGGPAAPERHVPGWHWLCWFCLSAYFEEVVLFADCCRTAQGEWAVRPFPLEEVRGQSAGNVKWVRGFATQYGRTALEHQMGKGRGLFTEKLLEALAHARDVNGCVTASTVREYFAHLGDLKEWRGRQVPSLVFEGDVVFSAGEPEVARVRVRAGNGSAPTIEGGPRGGPWGVRPGKGAGEYEVDLPRGIYAAKVPGKAPAFFEVTQVPGELDVSV